MKKYDFVLLEPLYWKTAHITIDIKTLARILTAAGLKVAVINYLRNDTYHENKEYDVINIYPATKFPDRSKIFLEKVILDLSFEPPVIPFVNLIAWPLIFANLIL